MQQLLDGQSWRGIKRTPALFVLELAPSVEHSGYWHFRAYDFGVNAEMQTKRPVIRDSILSHAEHVAGDLSEFVWTRADVQLREFERCRLAAQAAKKKKRSVVYFLLAGQFVKIGTTGSDVESRINELQTGCPCKIVILKTVPGSTKEERRLHERFSHLRSYGEWFRYEGDLLGYIESLS